MGVVVSNPDIDSDDDIASWAAVTRASGFDAFAATPSSANLRALVTDESGSGALLFANGALGTPSSGVLTNATGLPISTGVAGLGTGVATALAVNVGSAGAPVVNGGALGTPSSGTLTNATGLPVATGISGLGTDWATVLGLPAAGILDNLSGVRYVATYAALTALTTATGLSDNSIYCTYGRAAEEDGGFGFWRYDSGSTATADGGTVLAIDGGGAGRFYRLGDLGRQDGRWFGITSGSGASASTNWTLHEAWMTNSATSGKDLVLPAADIWKFSRSIRPRSDRGFIVEGPDTEVEIAGTSVQWPATGAIITGYASAQNHRLGSTYALDSLVRGSNTITTTTAAHAGNFIAGDCCIVESTATYNNGIEDISTYQQRTVIVSADSGTGEIVTRHGINMAGTDFVIRRTSRTGVTAIFADGVTVDTGQEVGDVRDARVIGGHWKTLDADGPFMGDGGAIDCVFAPLSVTCSRGPGYGNSYANCKFSAQMVRVTRALCELGYGSTGTTVDIQTATLVPGGTVTWMVGISEGSRSNAIRIGTLLAYNTSADSCVHIGESSQNRVEIGGLYANDIDNEPVRIIVGTYTGTEPPGGHNYVRIDNSYVGTQNQYIYTDGTGCDYNRVEGKFFGTVSGGVNNYNDGGANNTFNCYFENGADVLEATAGINGMYDGTAAMRVATRGATAALAASSERDGRIIYVPDNSGGGRLAMYLSGVPYTITLGSAVSL